MQDASSIVAAPGVEALETRVHLSAAPVKPAGGAPFAVLLPSGVVSVSGTSGPDTISVAESSGQIVVTENGVASQPFQADAETGVGVNGGPGDDSIRIEAGLVPSLVVGGGGADTIVGRAGSIGIMGGPGADVLVGGPGTNIIMGGKGADTLVGGSGKNFLYGDGGSDSITAGPNADALYGGGGNDTLAAASHAGTDTLFGGEGINQVEGQAGDSVIAGPM